MGYFMKKSTRLKFTVYIVYKELTAVSPPLIELKGAPSCRHDLVELLTQMIEIKYIILMVFWHQRALWVLQCSDKTVIDVDCIHKESKC